MIYHVELLLLFLTLVALGQLVRPIGGGAETESIPFGLAELPG